MDQGLASKTKSAREFVGRRALSLTLSMGLAVLGCALGAAVFLKGLDFVTRLRIADTRWFLFAPIGGLITGLVLGGRLPGGVRIFGFNLHIPPQAAHGNALLVSLVRRPDLSAGSALDSVPAILSPLIVVLTWVSHLGGLSVGREGTAVQMGGGIAAMAGKFLGVRSQAQGRFLLQFGMASGFGAVFGVPLAGAVFALEVAQSCFHAISRGQRPRREFALKPDRLTLTFVGCWFGSFTADALARFLGAEHFHFPSFEIAAFSSLGGVSFVVAGAVLFGLTAWLFLFSLGIFGRFWSWLVKPSYLRPALAGLIYALMTFAPNVLQTFAGIGSDAIKSAFVSAAGPWEWGGKLLFSVFAIGSEFKGGEVTPLLFIGATLGSWLASVASTLFPILIQVPVSGGASLGMVTIFAAAADLPVTCAVMAGELFGASAFVVALPTCLIANWVCRHTRLYDHKLAHHAGVPAPKFRNPAPSRSASRRPNFE